MVDGQPPWSAGRAQTRRVPRLRWHVREATDGVPEPRTVARHRRRARVAGVRGSFRRLAPPGSERPAGTPAADAHVVRQRCRVRGRPYTDRAGAGGRDQLGVLVEHVGGHDTVDARDHFRGAVVNWPERWPDALTAWGRFTQVHSPDYCASTSDARAAGLTGSFAMFRLNDRTVVLDVQAVAELGLEDMPVEVMAHEIGHHVLCPADLADNA